MAKKRVRLEDNRRGGLRSSYANVCRPQKAASDKNAPMEDRFAAPSSLPRCRAFVGNAHSTILRNHRPSEGVLSQAEDEPYCVREFVTGLIRAL